MRQVEVDAVDAEPPQARLRLAQDPLPGEPEVGAVLHRVERLRGDPWLVAGRPHPVTDPLLAPSAAVRVGGVELPQPERPGGVHQLERLLFGLPLAEERGRGADPAEVAAAENDAHRSASYV